jgi:hypothetical protein
VVLACGCARPDWIQNTLVTADVTGAWRSTTGNLELKLEQQGAKVAGYLAYLAGSGSTVTGEIDGSVRGDVLRFKQTSGRNIGLQGEMTVSGDAMNGSLRSLIGTRAQVRLQRVESAQSSPR